MLRNQLQAEQVVESHLEEQNELNCGDEHRSAERQDTIAFSCNCNGRSSVEVCGRNERVWNLSDFAVESVGGKISEPNDH